MPPCVVGEWAELPPTLDHCTGVSLRLELRLIYVYTRLYNRKGASKQDDTPSAAEEIPTSPRRSSSVSGSKG